MAVIPYLFIKSTPLNDFLVKSFSDRDLSIVQGVISTATSHGGTLDKTFYCMYDACRLLNGTSDMMYNSIITTSAANVLAKESTVSRHILYRIRSTDDLAVGFYGLWGRYSDANNYESFLLEVYLSAGNKLLRYRYKLVDASVTVYDITVNASSLASHQDIWENIDIVLSDQICYINGTNRGTSATASTFTASTVTVGRAYLNGTDYYFKGYIDTCKFHKGLIFNKNYTVVTGPEFTLDLNYLDTQILEDFGGISNQYPKLLQENRVSTLSSNFIGDVLLTETQLLTLGWGGSIGPNPQILFSIKLPGTFSISNAAGGSLTASTTYYYKLAVLDTESGIESELSDVGVGVTTGVNKTLNFTNLFADRNLTFRSSTSHLVKRIYRSTDNVIFRYIGTIAWGTNVFTDDGTANANGHTYVPNNLIGVASYSLTVPTLSGLSSAGAGVLAGTFGYILTNYDPLTGIESACTGETTFVAGSNIIRVTYNGGLGYGYSLRIYRRNVGTGQQSWYLVTELPNVSGALTYDDNTSDANLSAIRISDRTYLTLSGATGNPDICEKFNSRLWIVDSVKLNRLWFSEVNKFSQFLAASYIDIGDPFDPITSINSYLNALIIFKETSIYVLTGDNASNFRIIRIITGNNIGCSSKWTVKLVQNNLIFANGFGVHLFNGSSATTISEDIKDIFETIKPNARAIMTSCLDLTNKLYLLGINTTNNGDIGSSGISITGYDKVLVLHYEDLQKPIWTQYNLSGNYLTNGNYVGLDTPIATKTGLSVWYKDQDRGQSVNSITYKWEGNPVSINGFYANRFEHLKFTLDTSELTTNHTITVGFIVGSTTTNTNFTVLTQEDLEIKPSVRAKYMQPRISGTATEKLIVTGFKVNAEQLGFR